MFVHVHIHFSISLTHSKPAPSPFRRLTSLHTHAHTHGTGSTTSSPTWRSAQASPRSSATYSIRVPAPRCAPSRGKPRNVSLLPLLGPRGSRVLARFAKPERLRRTWVLGTASGAKRMSPTHTPSRPSHRIPPHPPQTRCKQRSACPIPSCLAFTRVASQEQKLEFLHGNAASSSEQGPQPVAGSFEDAPECCV